MPKYVQNLTTLYSLINECRVKKTPDEMAQMHQVGDQASKAHVFVMRNLKAGMSEMHAAVLLRFWNGFHMGSTTPYGEIAATKQNGAVLHYHNNSDTLSDGDMFQFDAGARVHHFCSDITTTWPISGKFTEKQKKWYNNVQNANLNVKKSIKPGVHWQDMHCLAEKTILEGQLEQGVQQGATAQELWEKRLSWYFMPHGLGHYIGIYTHDFQGNPYKENEKRPIKNQSIRVHRVLEENMCLTNEPGCYIIWEHLKELKNDEDLSKYVNWKVLEEYSKEIMACRIEDDQCVTADGCEYFTKLPRTVEQIEACLRNENWEHL